MRQPTHLSYFFGFLVVLFLTSGSTWGASQSSGGPQEVIIRSDQDRFATAIIRMVKTSNGNRIEYCEKDHWEDDWADPVTQFRLCQSLGFFDGENTLDRERYNQLVEVIKRRISRTQRGTWLVETGAAVSGVVVLLAASIALGGPWGLAVAIVVTYTLSVGEIISDIASSLVREFLPERYLPEYWAHVADALALLAGRQGARDSFPFEVNRSPDGTQVEVVLHHTSIDDLRESLDVALQYVSQPSSSRALHTFKSPLVGTILPMAGMGALQMGSF